MMPSRLFSDTFIVKYDDKLQSLLIIHPDKNLWSRPIARIRAETLATMNFEEASRFLGKSLIVMIPQLCNRFAEYLYTKDAERYLENLERYRNKTSD